MQSGLTAVLVVNSYWIDSITTTSPLGVPTMRTLTGLRSLISLFHVLLLFTTSTIFVLLGSSKRTYLPSGVCSVKVLVVVVTGQSVTSVVFSVLVW